MDSYYLDNVGRQLLKDSGVRYIAALKPDRFDHQSSETTKSTTLETVAGHGTRPEAKLHKSRDKSIGEKFCFSTASSTVGLSSTPFQDTSAAVEKEAWNYQFTSVLINTSNAWNTILKQRDGDRHSSRIS